jgi:hypothetical protein
MSPSFGTCVELPSGLGASSDDAPVTVVEFADYHGMRPHRTNDNSRMGSLGFWRMTGIGWVGATL